MKLTPDQKAAREPKPRINDPCAYTQEEADRHLALVDAATGKQDILSDHPHLLGERATAIHAPETPADPVLTALTEIKAISARMLEIMEGGT